MAGQTFPVLVLSWGLVSECFCWFLLPRVLHGNIFTLKVLGVKTVKKNL